LSKFFRGLLIGLVVLSVAGCGNSGLFKNRTGKKVVIDTRPPDDKALGAGKFSDLFSKADSWISSALCRLKMLIRFLALYHTVGVHPLVHHGSIGPLYIFRTLRWMRAVCGLH
jgi:hypothetical protein